jgi:hypothetical protein
VPFGVTCGRKWRLSRSVTDALRRFGRSDANDLIRFRRGAYVAQGALVVRSLIEERAFVHTRGNAVDGNLNLAGFDDDDLVVCIDGIGGCLACIEARDVTFKSEEGEGVCVDADDAGTCGRGSGGKAVAVQSRGGKFVRDPCCAADLSDAEGESCLTKLMT